MQRLGPVLLLLASFAPLLAPPAFAQAACQLSGGFAQLQAQLPDLVGACSGSATSRPELGEATQPTSNGRLIYHTVDGIVSFSDGSHTWVLDPNGQVQVRNVDERFPFEFNGDGFPLVGQPAPQVNGVCPTAPLSVLAVENFYASLVNQLGGQCVATTTILSDPDADPHEFQPTAADVRAFQGAQLVVEDGLGYDDFADKILASMPAQPALVKAGDVLGLQVGANPHVWYSAGYVDQMRAAILARLKALNPLASAYYDARSAALDQEFATYHGLINQIASQYGGAPVGATESIFVDMAYTLGLNLVSPPEFMQAIAEGNDPSVRDVAAFQNQVQNRQIKVLVYNTQTVTSLTEQLKSMAQQKGIPIVGVSETMPLGAQTFQGWQSTELELLRQALEKAAASP
ncbi:MAG: zinc ABC transporter substrate-binding protein [Chloroflexi bacterium]|nr:zinc ABC transporter substrate-binding protein [Chloroflexota bacterium]